jgi:polar amino acid transport system ATP-binding protein
MLVVENLSKSFGEQKVLDEVSLTLNRGETLVITGPSGGGKTTLLRLLNGLERPDSGVVRGVKSFGLIFQDFNLFPQYTALENLELTPRILGKQFDQAEKLLRRLGLADKLNAYPSELSGGQKQRVAIARALMLRPSVLCFDEPTSALDPSLTSDIAGLINSLKPRQTMIIVTHDIRFGKRVADKMATMTKGKLIWQDT